VYSNIYGISPYSILNKQGKLLQRVGWGGGFTENCVWNEFVIRQYAYKILDPTFLCRDIHGNET
jgi:hypothetical protein